MKEGRNAEDAGRPVLPPPANPSLAFLGLGEGGKNAEKAASAFSCRAFCIEEGKGFGFSALPGGGEVIRLEASGRAPLPHLLFPLLPEEASLIVFDPGRVEIKRDLYSLSSCYITDIGSREVLKNFSLLKTAGEKAIDLSWMRGEGWRERIKASLLSRIPAFFEVETGRIDAPSLLLAGWAKEEFGVAAKFKQAPCYSSSVLAVSFGSSDWQVRIEAEKGKVFSITEKDGLFKVPLVPKDLSDADFLIRQMELLPPDPLFLNSLDFEVQGAKDVG